MVGEVGVAPTAYPFRADPSTVDNTPRKLVRELRFALLISPSMVSLVHIARRDKGDRLPFQLLSHFSMRLVAAFTSMARSNSWYSSSAKRVATGVHNSITCFSSWSATSGCPALVAMRQRVLWVNRSSDSIPSKNRKSLLAAITSACWAP